MATPISSSAVAGSIEANVWTLLTAATSVEQQFLILAAHLQRKETDYNRNNPTETPKNRITIIPDYEAGQLNMTSDLLLKSDATMRSLIDSVTPHIPD